MAQFTKKAIIATFLELLSKYSLDKITITDITEKCEINRKTFYYYYEDIYALIEDIFQMEAQKVLDDAQECASFYEEFNRAIILVLQYKQAVIHLYHSKSKDVLEKYLYNVTERFIMRYVKKYAEEVHASEQDVQFACNYYRSTIIAATLEWIKNGTKEAPEVFVQDMSDIFEQTVKIVLAISAKKRK